jgi:hypothetical protein
MKKGVQTPKQSRDSSIQSPTLGGGAFLQRVEVLKRRHGDGVRDFEPAPLDFVPYDPFSDDTAEPYKSGLKGR